MHLMEILDGLLGDLHWLRESAALRRRARSLGSRQPPATRPLFFEVVIEWDDTMLDAASESVGC